MRLSVFISTLILVSLTMTQAHAESGCISLRSSPLYQEQHLKAINDVKNRIEESPFMVACHEPPGLLKGRPETGLFTWSVVDKDQYGYTSREFLKSVLAKIRLRISNTKTKMQSAQACMDNKSPQCAKMYHWVHDEIPEYVKAARYNLSLAQSPSQVKSWVDIASTSVNKNLDPEGSYKFEDWDPLDSEELAASEKVLAGYKSDIEKSYHSLYEKGDRTDRGKYLNESLKGTRYRHFMEYHQAMAELPLMQYLKGRQTTSKDLNVAFGKMNAGLDKETQKLNELETMLNKPGQLPKDVLTLMNYSSEVEQTLLDTPNECGLATSLLYTMSNKQLFNKLVVGLPILAVSMFVPPLIGFGVGLVGGAYGVASSFQDFRETQARTLNYIDGDTLSLNKNSDMVQGLSAYAQSGPAGFKASSNVKEAREMMTTSPDLNALEDSKAAIWHSAITLPMGTGIGSAAGSGIRVSAGAWWTSKMVFHPY